MASDKTKSNAIEMQTETLCIILSGEELIQPTIRSNRMLSKVAELSCSSSMQDMVVLITTKRVPSLTVNDEEMIMAVINTTSKKYLIFAENKKEPT